MHYTNIAFCSINDSYIQGVEYTHLKSKKIKDVILKIRLKLNIFKANCMQRLGFRKSSTILVAMFKSPPDLCVENSMKKAGWRFKVLPSNPYIA